MTALLDAGTADKLARICGLFGSHHDGERAAAAAMADKIVKAHGLTWSEIVLKVALGAARDKIALCLANIDALSMWERGFIYAVDRKKELSPKQLAVLDQIETKARAYAEAAS